MSRLIAEITADQIDDWFKIGKKNVKVQSIARSSTGGRSIDPKTKQQTQVEVQHVPHYRRRPEFAGGHEYAEAYQKEEQEQLLNRRTTFDDHVSDVSSHLEALELDSLTTAPIAHPSDLAPENAMEVYKQYNFSHQYDSKLPISKYKEQVIATVESNQVTVIQGATGSGKTTQVPQYILDHYAQQGKYCNIIVTQPRRIAARSIAERVCQERNWQTGTVCGYQVSLDKVANEDTRILYCTVGILLQKLVNSKNMQEYTHVILDEVHERDQDTDFSLLVVRKLLHTNSRHTRVIIMSATFESQLFAQYFALSVRGQLEQAPVVNVEGKPFKVLEFYAEDLTQLGPTPMLDEGLPEISDEARNLAVSLIQHFDKLEGKEQALGPHGFAPIRGTVLVFLPGEYEIKLLQNALEDIQLKHMLHILVLHSTITVEEQRKVFLPVGSGQRKVILSTNIAESSITVPDIKYVIDFCLTKNLVCDFETNYTCLQVNWASKANCIQRKGRAGRVSNGRVYRLVTRLFYENSIQDYGTPEMQRCPLDKLILQVKKLDMGEPKAILALALSPPNLDDIERNILMLKEVGALSTLPLHTQNRHDGQLTFVGHVLAALPVDPHIGKLVIMGHVFGLLEECLIIGAAMSLKSVFAKPFKVRLEAYRHKLGWAHGSLSDCLAILLAYKTWERSKNTGAFKRSGAGGEAGWGRKYYLQIRRLKEIAELVKDMEKRLMKFNILKPQHEPRYKKDITDDQETLLLKMVLCGAFYPNYFVRGEIDELESLKSMSGRDPLNTVMVKGLPANQGTLYKQELEVQFGKCESNPKVYFEETRAYVEFPWKPNSNSKVHFGVYMACKMQQLRVPIQLELLSSDETHAMLRRLETSQTKNAVPGKLRTNRLTLDSNVIEESGGRRFGVHVAPPDPSKSIICICITEVVDCGYFWAQYHEEESFAHLQFVHKALNGGAVLKPLTGYARVGSFCVAPYQDETLEYYRAKIHAVETVYDERIRANREYVEVFFLDYGNYSKLTKEELRELPNDLLKVPFQAVECRLKGIRPSHIKCPDGKWTKEAKETFKQLVSLPRLFAQVYSVVHGVLRVELVHNIDGLQIYIHQKLIDMGFADEAEESFTSKQNHEHRMTEATVSMTHSKPHGKKYSPEKEEDWLHVSLAGSTVPVPTSRQRGSQITLHGPTNPYQMNFYSITNIGRLRPVKIDLDSVNSVAIDDEPQDPHQRMMVAGFVSLNPNGSSVVARDTTIMPLIPGLPALVLLLFSPVAELRTDPKKKIYTGALCGLGIDHHSEYPAFPDHDIEMAFDVKLDLEDIYKINGVRMAISIAVGSADSVASWGPDAVYKLQASARKKLLDLIQRRRESIEPRMFQNPYQWNQVDPDDIMEPGLDQQDWPVLYTSHSAIALVEDEPEEGAEATDNVDYLYYRKHVEDLHAIAKSKKKKGPTLCELCGTTCPTPQLLSLHLEISKHKEHERRLNISK